MNLKELVRPNIWNLKPYSSARHEFEGAADVYLDANENPNDTGYNRYPDPLQKNLKALISKQKEIDSDCIFLGNGSDEAIDILMRIFCRPGQDEIIILPPTYGMYQVSADICDVTVRTSLLSEEFQPSCNDILSKINDCTKLLFICSPNNPTGNLVSKENVTTLLESFQGIIIIDEAYVDFSSESSWIQQVDQYSNLVVLQTFSKAWGMAGIRLGMAFASPEIIRLMNAVKPPYNINQLTQEKGVITLESQLRSKEDQVLELIAERETLAKELEQHPSVIKVYPSDANFLLVKFHNHNLVFKSLKEKGIVVRDRSNTPMCDQCLRITVGTKKENQLVLQTLRTLK